MTTASVPVEPTEPQEPPAPSLAVRVLNVTWERVHLTIHLLATPAIGADLAADKPVDFEIFTGARAFPVDVTDHGDGRYDLVFNVTTFVDRRAIPNGTWRIRAVIDGQPDGVATLEASHLAALDDAARVFLYNSNRSAYTVSFGISENDIELEFQLRVYEFNQPPGKTSWRRFPKRIRKALLGPNAKRRYARWIYSFFRRTIGPRKNQILFASEQRVAIEGNLRRVQERLIERGLDERFSLRYSFRVPGNSEWKTTIRILYLLATSEIVLLDDYFAMLGNIEIDDRTKVIQLWHAGSGFKAVGFSRFGNAGSPKLSNAHRAYTYAITGSEHLVHVYSEAFGIEPAAVIPTGLPRVDWFLDEARTAEFTSEFYAEYPALKGKRVILFAPTFRGRSIKSAFYDYDLIDFAKLYELCGPDTVVLFRMHHFVSTPITIPAEYADRFFDFTKYPRGLDLLHVTDLLITDYSSIIYEYSLLDRPMLFFAPDKVNYAATRGFHRDFDETAPGRVAMTFDEVLDAIRDGEFEVEKVAAFRAENFDRVDTGAADRVIDWLLLADPAPSAGRAAHATTHADDAELNEERNQEDEGL
ncbi:CDP-glycerol glycerophosphotransferase family protein [Demequina sp.]|uniref:CDP-glycerol glycerophosphotransferase family protein n=1 Tax=Demequina sp. TaxID=2050685 RepID=UPI003D13EB48